MALINTTGVRLTSSRSFPGTLTLNAAQVSALWLTTSTDPGTSFASRRGRLRDKQLLRGEFLHRQPAPFRRAPQQEHLYPRLGVHTIAGYVYARTPHGLLKAWLSQASSAELPTRGALISLSPTFTSTTSAPSPNGQRRLSSIQTAFSHASFSWPTNGVSLL